MKQKDIALILVIVVFSGVVSFIVSGAVFAPAKDRQQNVEVVDPITANFTDPDDIYFNSNAVDPTQLIQIGTSTNPTPFNGTTQ